MSPPTQRAAIRQIFLRRQPEYSAREAAGLLRLSLDELRTWVDTRHALVTWNELASAAMLRWTLVEIHDALGEEANRVLPKLLRPAALAVRIPEYLLRFLEKLAQRAGQTVEGYIADALLGLEANGDLDEIEDLLPGFREAMSFPDVQS